MEVLLQYVKVSYRNIFLHVTYCIHASDVIPEYPKLNLGMKSHVISYCVTSVSEIMQKSLESQYVEPLPSI